MTASSRTADGRAGGLERSASRRPFQISWLTFAILAAFAAAMVAVPWEAIFGPHFWDRGVYLNTFRSFHPEQAKSFTGSIVSFVMNEAVWDIGVRWLSAVLHVPVDSLFDVISFFCIFTFAKYLAGRHGLLSLPLLVNPLVVDFAFSQLRMALAAAILITALFHKRRWGVSTALISLACLVHTASFLFLLIYFASRALVAYVSRRRSSGGVYWVGLVGIALTVVILIGPLRTVILTALGDRRAEYKDPSQGILYASYWIFLMFAYYGERKPFYETEGNSLAVACVSVFALASIFNVYNQRFLAASFPLIISSILSLGGQKRILILGLFLVYAAAQWYFWTIGGLS
jgi:hypothetical protein